MSVAVAGAVLAAGVLAGCTGGDAPDASATGDGAASTGVEPSKSPAVPSPGGGVGAGTVDISQDDARRIATAKYGGTVTSVEDDHHDGEATWEVELRDSSQGRIEVEVSKATGAIVSVEQDD